MISEFLANNRVFLRFCTIAVGITLSSSFAEAQNQTSDASHSIILFPGNFQSIGASNKPVKFGWNIPGSQYRSGAGWWALICEANDEMQDAKPGCRLAPTNLLISKGTHPVYDGEAMPSQLLSWAPLPKVLAFGSGDKEQKERLMIVFKPVRTLVGLKLSAGPVTTYLHVNMDGYPSPPSPGTMEVRIPMGAGQYADLIPRIIRSSNGSTREPTTNAMGEIAYEVDFLELRIGEKRQRLPGEWSGCSQGILRWPEEYLWWAGDLDGDGKLDFILSRDGSEHVILYLSSVAKGNELVGEAGSFVYENPARGEC